MKIDYSKAFRIWRRKNHPAMRRSLPVGVSQKPGGRLYTCLCRQSISCSDKYPITKRCEIFIAKHNVECFPAEAVKMWVESLPECVDPSELYESMNSAVSVLHFPSEHLSEVEWKNTVVAVLRAALAKAEGKT